MVLWVLITKGRILSTKLWLWTNFLPLFFSTSTNVVWGGPMVVFKKRTRFELSVIRLMCQKISLLVANVAIVSVPDIPMILRLFPNCLLHNKIFVRRQFLVFSGTVFVFF